MYPNGIFKVLPELFNLEVLHVPLENGAQSVTY